LTAGLIFHDLLLLVFDLVPRRPELPTDDITHMRSVQVRSVQVRSVQASPCRQLYRI